MTALTHAKTHQRNVSHISLASTSASSGFGPVRSSCSWAEFFPEGFQRRDPSGPVAEVRQGIPARSDSVKLL